MPDKNQKNQEAAGDELEPSKSARKRQMHSLQNLGESLLELNEQQLAKIPMENEQLLDAILDCKRIKTNSARKRHLQLIGKLMRHIDPVPIEKAIAAIHQNRRTESDEFHQLELLRDRILAEGDAGIEAALSLLPSADRKHIRQLALQHHREIKKNKPPAASRKLFKYLREVSQT
jgi:ribosome-associated protein